MFMEYFCYVYLLTPKHAVLPNGCLGVRVHLMYKPLLPQEVEAGKDRPRNPANLVENFARRDWFSWVLSIQYGRVHLEEFGDAILGKDFGPLFGIFVHRG